MQLFFLNFFFISNDGEIGVHAPIIDNTSRLCLHQSILAQAFEYEYIPRNPWHIDNSDADLSWPARLHRSVIQLPDQHCPAGSTIPDVSLEGMHPRHDVQLAMHITCDIEQYGREPIQHT